MVERNPRTPRVHRSREYLCEHGGWIVGSSSGSTKWLSAAMWRGLYAVLDGEKTRNKWTVTARRTQVLEHEARINTPTADRLKALGLVIITIEGGNGHYWSCVHLTTEGRKAVRGEEGSGDR